jgi:hypothetical protein
MDKGHLPMMTEHMRIGKNGTTKLAGQTKYRLLNCVPPALSFEQRYDLILKVWTHHQRKTELKFQFVTDEKKEEMVAKMEALVRSIEMQPIPDAVRGHLRWLADRDNQRAERLIAVLKEKEKNLARQARIKA